MGRTAKSPSKTAKSAKTMEELQEETLEKLNILTRKLEDLEETLKTVSSENRKLKETIACQADEIMHLKDCLNEREAYARSWSMRVLNVKLPQGQETNTRVVMDTIYKGLFLPILQGAMANKEISSIPSCDTLLETAHPLPGKGDNKPVIVRFFSRYWRSVIFRYRKNYAPRETAPANTRGGAENHGGRMVHPFFEDLSKATFKQLVSIKACSEVTSAWTVGGAIRFKIKDSEVIFRVSSIYDTVDSLTKK